ncbi:MAG: hypothetical protein HN750_15815 [Gemmatimonadales bacterium]|nr:hypothetical protein [Gemmatimonadales bacterium]
MRRHLQIDKSDYAMGYSGSGNSMAPYLGHKTALQILGDPGSREVRPEGTGSTSEPRRL